MLFTPPALIGSLLLIASLTAYSQNFLPLDFSHNVQATNAQYPNNSTLGPDYYSGTVLDFKNVTTSNGQVIDARVNILGTAGSYEYVGLLPGYNDANGQAGDDLGVYYRHINGDFSEPTGGMAYTITFFDGDSSFTNLATLSDFRLLIYDFDGEPGQSESIHTFVQDGFTGYQIYDGSGITATNEGATYRFDSGGSNQSETGPGGSFIAYYQNTSSIRFDLFSTTLPSNPAANNGVFAGFDGNLGVSGGQTSGFGSFVPIPEPSSFSLTACALSLGLLRRRDRR